jgi:uncharacterized protein (TIGR02996 family)
MTHEDSFLQAISAAPGDDTLRLVYSDWLEEHGCQDRAELIRVCQAMRQVPVFSDRYWQLKARRNELRPGCPGDWLAATGCDGSHYDPLYRDGIPPDWKGRWRLIREFTERWHGIPMGDVGGRRDEIRAERRRLGRRLPPSVREYIAYAHDVAPPEQFGIIHRDVYTMQPLDGHQALSVMVIAEGDVQWAIRNGDLRRPDPPIYTYHWADGDETRYVPAEGEGAQALSDFVLGFVTAYKPEGGSFMTQVWDAPRLREQLDAAFPVRIARHRGITYEGGGILAHLYPAHRRQGFDLRVSVHPSVTWERVPGFLWEYARYGNPRGGMFLSEQDRREMRGHWGNESPPPGFLAPAPPPPAGSGGRGAAAGGGAPSHAAPPAASHDRGAGRTG